MIGDFRPFVSIGDVQINKFLEVFLGPFLVFDVSLQKVDVPELYKDDLSLHCW